MNQIKSVIALMFAYAIFLNFIFLLSGTANASEYYGISENYIKKDELLVKYRNRVEPIAVKLPDYSGFSSFLKAYNNNPDIEYAEPIYLYRQAALIKSDPLFRNQWYLQKVKAPEAWNMISESPDVIIAIIDTGTYIKHTDLKSNIWVNKKEIPGNKKDDDLNGYIDDINGWDFVNNVSDPSPKFKEGFTEDGIMHGTIVSGIAAARGGNEEGIFGTTWKAQLMELKALDDSGEGNTLDVIRSIDYAIANGANIINLSFVGPGYSQGLEQAIKRAHNAGLIIIAAAGNEQENGEGYSLDKTPMYPVCHDGPNGENWVIGVAATDAIDQKAIFSSYGFKCIDIVAPGISIFSTTAYYPDKSLDNRFFSSYYDGYWSGTSVAAPIVTGAMSLILEADPSLSKKQAIDDLLNGADNVYRVNPNYLGQLGRGRLNMLNSIDLARAPLNDFIYDILVAPYSKSSSTVRFFNESGKYSSSSTFMAYEPSFSKGINMASGDIDGDKQFEIITVPNQGGGPQIRIFKSTGKLIGQFFSYNKNFAGGVNITTGDVNGDGIDEIITGPGPGGGPQVKIFNSKGKLLYQFFAYKKTFTGGISVAAGDINGDGMDEIITGPGPGGGPHVRIFSPNGKVLGQFFAYDNKFSGGVKVASGDIQPLAFGIRDEIITAPWTQSQALVKIFNFKHELIGQFLAFHSKFKGGINLATGDLNNDGKEEIITGAGSGGAPQVRAFELDGNLISSFYAFKENFSGGISLAAIKTSRETNPFQ
jgi:subtilisin family serine protease